MNSYAFLKTSEKVDTIFVQVGFSVSRVTDKKSSWILLYFQTPDTQEYVYTVEKAWLKLD